MSTPQPTGDESAATMVNPVEPLDRVTQATLLYWRNHPVRATDIPYHKAVESLGSDEPLVEFRQQSASRWTVRRCV